MRRVAALALAVWLLWASPAAAVPDPVVLVHGSWPGTASTMSTIQQRLTAAGYTAAAVSLPGNNNMANARAIVAFAAARGWTRYAIVAHSMGGLSSRYAIKSLGANVSRLVQLGTPNYGINRGCWSWFEAQMCPSSSFLAALNSGDDTPGPTAYTTLYSTGDTIVPAASSRLDGGACHVQVPGVSHTGLLTNPGVISHVLSSLGGSCPGVLR